MHWRDKKISGTQKFKGQGLNTGESTAYGRWRQGCSGGVAWMEKGFRLHKRNLSEK